MKRSNSAKFGPWILLLVLLVFWEYSATFMGVPEFVLPRLSKVARIFLDQTALALYLANAYVTLQEALFGLLIGGVLGFVVGVALTESRALFNTVYPFIIALQCMPKVAIAPLLVIWLGFGISSKITVVALLCFFPVLVNTISGIRGVSTETRELFRAIRASRLTTLIHLLIPAALPSILTGVEIAIVVSLLGAIVGEFVGAEKGLGVLLLQAQFQMNIPGVFAVLLVLAVLGVIFNLAIRILRKRVLFWIPGESGTG